ncbi:hypothetical protein BM86_32250 [Bacillus thuringiensis]|uniref:Uncharacterized protein n=1 Tax=Bacillus thuringiensis TaxID=1428 RepID=A0A9W3SIS1_BACTU|nr:hypothetical protein [Bacillus thuringiensis]ANS51926.1 hypothetical protein BT246_66340 [Bacillus thuringiensis]ANS52020.1 hypothetical protein BT246_67280 [Bacillus thuringiensis]ANS52044.1 hypothetical protein BT246_67520 [Bacillus thuringiensis]MBH0336797.1 hypothetical protein [Bacillus thuringiensis]MBH0340001.1 hypothetical protein [Bacillus thuringiensis]
MQNKLTQIRKKSIPMLIVGGMILASGALASHQACADTLDNTNKELTEYKTISDINIDASSKPMLDFMIKLANSGALDEMEYDSDFKVVSLKHDFATIQSMYQFTDEEMVYFRKFYNLLQSLG